MAIFHSCVSLPDILSTNIEPMLGAVGWFRFKSDQPWSAGKKLRARGPDRHGSQKHEWSVGFTKYTTIYLSPLLQKCPNNVSFNAAYYIYTYDILYIYHACTDPICFFLPICQRRPVAGHVNGMSMGYSPNVAMSYHWDSIGIMMIDIVWPVDGMGS